MTKEKKGVIYILTNPSFEEYVKIGYADDIDTRLAQLNSSECTPFGFRVYATYEVDTRLTDLKIHAMIDKLNPNLRAIDNINGKKRVREFYAISAEDAYGIFEAMAEISGTTNRLKLIEPSAIEKQEAIVAKEIADGGYKDVNYSTTKNDGDDIMVQDIIDAFDGLLDGCSLAINKNYISYQLNGTNRNLFRVRTASNNFLQLAIKTVIDSQLDSEIHKHFDVYYHKDSKEYYIKIDSKKKFLEHKDLFRSIIIQLKLNT